MSDKLNENQLKAIEVFGNSAVVVSSAGSGKTKVLTLRIKRLIEKGINPNNILAITFSKKATEEMKNRLSDLLGEVTATDLNISTIHSLCYSILRNSDNSFINKKIVQEWQQHKILDEALKNNEIELSNPEILSFIGYQKNHLLKSNDKLIFLVKMHRMYKDELKQLYSYYELEKKRQNLIDFDDMLTMCYDLLKNNKEIREKYQKQFKEILVDEFQDTNIAQYEILKLLSANRNNVFVVGDSRQALYGFRGSNVNLILDFNKDWKDSEVIVLDINYRSSKDIVKLSNKLIEQSQIKHIGNTKSNKPYYKKPIIKGCDSEYEEANEIIKQIKDIVAEGKYSYKDICILYRTNNQSSALEDSCIFNSIPYIVMGSLSFFKRKEIQDMIAYLKLINNSDNNAALERIINVPNRFFGKAFTEKLYSFANNNSLSYYSALDVCPICNEWRYSKNVNKFINSMLRLFTHKSKGVKPSELIEHIRHEFDYDDYITNTGSLEEDNIKIDNLDTFVNMATKYETLDLFLKYIDESLNKQESDINKGDKVNLMTIHRSKGLEYPIVFLAGVSQGILPHRKSIDKEEERRVCYVGMTRAIDELYISYTDTYQNKNTGKSMFLEDL